MPYVNLDTIQRAAVGTLVTAAWLDQVNDDMTAVWGEAAYTRPVYTVYWGDFGGVEQVVGYRKVGSRVVFRGTMKVVSGGIVGNSAFILPTAYRPPATAWLACNSNAGFGSLEVDALGYVTPTAGVSTKFSLDGVSFDTLT